LIATGLPFAADLRAGAFLAAARPVEAFLDGRVDGARPTLGDDAFDLLCLERLCLGLEFLNLGLKLAVRLCQIVLL
jgi:hypothetical protein